MISRARYILLNVYHIGIDGLYDSMPLLLSFIAIAFGCGEKEVGLIVSLAMACNTLTGLFTISFSRRLGFAGAAGLVMALYGAGFFAAAFSQHIVYAGLCFVVALSGHGIFHNIAFSYLTLHTERRSLGKMMSDFTAIGDIGRIPLVSLAGFGAAVTILGFQGWRVVCMAYGAAALVAAVCLVFGSFRAQDKEEEAKDAKPKRHLPSFALLRDRELALSMIASVLNAWSNDRIFTFLPLFLLARGLDPTIIGTFAFGFSVGSFLGKMACGRMVDRFGSRKVFVWAEIILTVLLAALLLSKNLALVIVISLLLGIVTRGTVPVIQTIITEPLPDPQHYDDVFSINTFLRGVTNILTPLLFGFIADAFGIDWIYALMAVVAAVAAVPVLMMGRK